MFKIVSASGYLTKYVKIDKIIEDHFTAPGVGRYAFLEHLEHGVSKLMKKDSKYLPGFKAIGLYRVGFCLYRLQDKDFSPQLKKTLVKLTGLKTGKRNKTTLTERFFEMAKRLIATDDVPYLKSRILTDLGLLQFNRGEQEKGVASLESAAKSVAEDSSEYFFARYYLAEKYVLLARYGDALATLPKEIHTEYEKRKFPIQGLQFLCQAMAFATNLPDKIGFLEKSKSAFTAAIRADLESRGAGADSRPHPYYLYLRASVDLKLFEEVGVNHSSSYALVQSLFRDIKATQADTGLDFELTQSFVRMRFEEILKTIINSASLLSRTTPFVRIDGSLSRNLSDLFLDEKPVLDWSIVDTDITKQLIAGIIRLYKEKETSTADNLYTFLTSAMEGTTWTPVTLDVMRVCVNDLISLRESGHYDVAEKIRDLIKSISENKKSPLVVSSCCCSSRGCSCSSPPRNDWDKAIIQTFKSRLDYVSKDLHAALEADVSELLDEKAVNELFPESSCAWLCTPNAQFAMSTSIALAALLLGIFKE